MPAAYQEAFTAVGVPLLSMRVTLVPYCPKLFQCACTNGGTPAFSAGANPSTLVLQSRTPPGFNVSPGRPSSATNLKPISFGPALAEYAARQTAAMAAAHLMFFGIFIGLNLADFFCSTTRSNAVGVEMQEIVGFRNGRVGPNVARHHLHPGNADAASGCNSPWRFKQKRRSVPLHPCCVPRVHCESKSRTIPTSCRMRLCLIGVKQKRAKTRPPPTRAGPQLIPWISFCFPVACALVSATEP